MASIPADYVRSVLQNGLGRYVCQLQRITLKFCKSQADSRGVRDFIENHLLEFTRENPGVVVYLKPRRHRAPCVVGEYLNGNMVQLPLSSKNKEEVCKWVEHLRCQSGIEVVRLKKMWHTDTPSIQGIWTPFTNKDTRLNVTTFPDLQNFKCRSVEGSATEKLLELAEIYKAERDEEKFLSKNDSMTASTTK